MADLRWVALGEVLRAHGIFGEIRVRLYNAESRAIAQGSELRLRTTRGECRAVVVDRVRPVPGGGLLVKLRGLDVREEVDRLRGSTLEVPREALPDADQDEFYVCDLVGASVVGPDGPLGRVERIANYPSADALVIRPQPGAPAVEVPLVDDFVERVDLDQRTIVLRRDALHLFAE